MFCRISISTLAIFLAMQLLSACCNCEEYPTPPADWTGMQLWYGSYTIDSPRINTTSDNSLDFSDRSFMLSWKPEIEVLAARFHPEAFSNCAYACKCDDVRSYRMRRKVTGISINTLYPFDGQHQPGSDITSLFKIPNPAGNALSTDPLRLPADILHEDWYTSVYLDARPDVHGPQRFELVLNLSDGGTIRDTTVELRF